MRARLHRTSRTGEQEGTISLEVFQGKKRKSPSTDSSCGDTYHMPLSRAYSCFHGLWRTGYRRRCNHPQGTTW
jgi:hypothetical protein